MIWLEGPHRLRLTNNNVRPSGIYESCDPGGTG